MVTTWLQITALAIMTTVASSRGPGAQPTAFTRQVQSLGSVEPVIPDPINLDAVLAEDSQRGSQGGPYRFAIRRPVQITPQGAGMWEVLDAETMLWRVPIASPGAVCLSLGFSRYIMPPGGTLFIYSADDSQVLGPYTAQDNEEHGQLWTPLLYADALIVELTIPVDKVPDLDLELTSVNHGYRGEEPFAVRKVFGNSGPCNRDVACGEGGPWRDQARSVARIQITRGDDVVWCTGSLVNNTAGDGRCYFLTAFHCFDQEPKNGVLTSQERQAAASMVTYWNYEASACDGWTSAPYQSQTGAVMRAWYNPSDFALVELDDIPSPDSNTYYAGWDRSGTVPPSGVTIHHPGGDLKKISIEQDPLSVTSYYGTRSPGGGTHLRVADWDVGTTENGSSGCPLFDPNERVVGQLSGGDAACGNDEADWFGRLYKSWTGGGTRNTRLMDWLDPLNSGVTTLDGTDAAGPMGTVVFEDTFSSKTIDQGKWARFSGATVDDRGIGTPSGSYSLRLNGDPSGGDFVESSLVDLSGYSVGTLTYSYQRTGNGESPDSGDDLIVEFHNGSIWVELDRQLGSGPDMSLYVMRIVPLPPEALHPAFQLRIRSIGRGLLGLGDDWFVDDVRIAAWSEGHVVFEDTFASTDIEATKWVVSDWATVDDTGIDEPSAPYSLRLNGHPLGGDTVESNVMDLSPYTEATLAYHYQRKGGGESPDDGDDLIVEVLGSLGWVELDRQSGGGPDMTAFELQTLPLPASALHSGFKLRIRSIGMSDPLEVVDDWFIDDVKITAK